MNQLPPSLQRGNKLLEPWRIRDRSFRWGERTFLMGILNVTPDSFSDGGLFDTVELATAQAQALAAAGMDILDIGGQSTRPQAGELGLDAELSRVIPVIESVRRVSEIPISIDTTKAAVAEAAVLAGANVVNDVSGATYDPDMLSVVARLNVPIVLMHLRGTPQTMQQLTTYDSLIETLLTFLQERVAAACAAGVDRSQIMVDPGLGFAKTGAQNIEILRQLDRFRDLDCPLLVGPSRKSFIGQILNQSDPKARVWGTTAACCAAIAGGADLIRVHDASMIDVCRVADALWRV